MKKLTLEQIRCAVSKIKIEKRDSKEGTIQREAFRIRWGKKPEDV
jgi:hypothetical protein